MDTTLAACTSPPQAPAVVAALVTGSLATLSWSAPIGGAEQFVVDVHSQSNGAALSVVTGGPVLGLRTSAPVGAYFVQVRGRNACGVGPPSASTVVFALWPGQA